MSDEARALARDDAEPVRVLVALDRAALLSRGRTLAGASVARAVARLVACRFYFRGGPRHGRTRGVSAFLATFALLEALESASRRYDAILLSPIAHNVRRRTSN